MLVIVLAGVAYVAWAHWVVTRPVVIGYNTVWSPLLRRVIPKRMRAVTLWNRVFLLRVGEGLTVKGKAHELVHVGQFRRWPASFPVRYLWAHLRDGGYQGNRYERQARGEAV